MPADWTKNRGAFDGCGTRFLPRVSPPRDTPITDPAIVLKPSGHRRRLAMYDLGQCPLNSIRFFTNHPDRLLTARIWHGYDCLYRVTNLVVAIPNQGDSRGGLHSVLVNPSSQFRSHPGER